MFRLALAHFWRMATIDELQAEVDETRTAIRTVKAGRSVQWGDRMVTMVNLPALETSLARAERALATAKGRRPYALASFD